MAEPTISQKTIQDRCPIREAEANDLMRVRLDGTATAEQLARHDELLANAANFNVSQRHSVPDLRSLRGPPQ
jgi:hypothetical protein